MRLWWRETPIDLFLNTTEYHEEIAPRARVERFAGEDVPFLSCTDLAVFKAFFDRTKDWADLEEMIAAGTLDRAQVLGVLVQYLGPDDPRVTRVRTLPSRWMRRRDPPDGGVHHVGGVALAPRARGSFASRAAPLGCPR